MGGQRFRLLTFVDNHSRESLAIEVGQQLTGGDVVRVLEHVTVQRGKPQTIHFDSGAAFISRSLDLSAYFNGVQVNLTPRKVKIALFGCPDDGLRENELNNVNWARVRANYVVNAGNTDYGQATKNGVHFMGAPFAPRTGVRAGTISDGLSKTLLTSEVITTLSSDWWGGPISDFSIALGGQTFTGWLAPNSLTPDESVRECPQPSQYNGIPGCNMTFPDEENTKRAVFAARSKHQGGVTASMCDGSVQFIADSVDLVGVWRRMTTANGEERVE